MKFYLHFRYLKYHNNQDQQIEQITMTAMPIKFNWTIQSKQKLETNFEFSSHSSIKSGKALITGKTIEIGMETKE